MRDFEAELEARFQAHKLSKRKIQESNLHVEEIDESWLLDPDEELAELEEDI